MKIPQLFVKIGNNKFSLVSRPVYNSPVYFWDDLTQRIIPDEGELKLRIIDGCPYLVLERT